MGRQTGINSIIMKTLLLFFLLIAGHTTLAQWPPHMEFDLQNEPFLHGVASGDPLTDRVIIWTRVTPPGNQTTPINVDWEVAIDSNFLQVVQSGSFVTDSTIDYTVKVDVTGLQPDFTYWYRFKTQPQLTSAVGRTRTAPVGSSNQHIRFGVCYGSSIYSGFMNSYRQIAARDDLSGIIHMGDYIYEFVDTDEQVRIPPSFPYFEGVASPGSLTEWRYIHNIYHMDIDFRKALNRHPLMVMWDNHDINVGDTSNSIKAFLEWTPTRLPEPSDSLRLYRRFVYGDLLDIFMVDMWQYKDSEPQNALLGTAQNQWLQNELLQSNSQWHVLAEQKPMGGWQLVLGLTYNENNTWEGYPSERDAFYNFLAAHNINNTIVLSGDAHVTIGMNLENQGAPVGAELLPASITRGNFDEMGFGAITGVAEAQSMLVNSHHVYINLVDQGYAVLDVTPTATQADMWYCDIMNVTDVQSLGQSFYSGNNSNKWESLPSAESIPIYNQAPDSIAVSNLSVPENSQAGTVIGTIQAWDPDQNDTHLFGLSDNANSRFVINGNQLVVNNAWLLNYESSMSHDITLFAVDNMGEIFEQNFTVMVTDVNEPPYHLELSDTIFDGSLVPGTTISVASVQDEDQNDSHTYSFVSGPGDHHNGLFSINGNNLSIGAGFQNVLATYEVRLRVTDAANNSYEESFRLHNTVLGDNTLAQGQELLLYPNPAKDAVVFLMRNSYAGKFEVQIADASGKIVFSELYEKKSEYFKRSLSLKELSAGTYEFVISGDGFTESRPLVIR